jgi:uncharacterized membrane protein
VSSARPSALAGTLRLIGAALLGCFAAAPLLPQLARYWPASAPLERAARVWFELHCERDPARTLSLFGVPLGVCARCSGIYFGVGLGALLRFPRLSEQATRRWVGLGAALMLLDVSLEDFGWHASWPAVRVVTGVLLAYPVGVGLGALLARAPSAPPQRP